MVLSHPFFCPTRIVEGEAFSALAALLMRRRFAVVTSAGWLKRGLTDELGKVSLAPDVVLAEVETNPTVSAVERLAEKIPDVDIVVAFGGGSAIDAAKGALALKALGQDRAAMRAHLEKGTALPAGIAPLPLIAVPTTAGTGSEVTRWGTIWGDDLAKYSVTDPSLYPNHAILDPKLLMSMPRALALSSGLDALSHAMEAVWNRRHGAATDELARSAISIVYRDLAASLDHPDSLPLKRAIQTAALFAGLAMGTTQTALAHSISYPFTSHFGLPHGIACSFTLPEIARYNLAAGEARLAPISDALGCKPGDIPEVLARWFEVLGVPREVGRYVDPSAVEAMSQNLITPSRAANNIRDVDGAAAREIVLKSFDRLAVRAA